MDEPTRCWCVVVGWMSCPAGWRRVGGRLGFNVLFLTKPETTLQIVMLIFFWDLIRPEILGLCAFLNLWSFIVYFSHTRKKALFPYKYETIRNDAKDAGVDGKTLAIFDKLAGK